ncbi:MAG: M3 family metallopeptidase [Desulfomicrobium sp.]|nr:M3 family metallopeptidase [Desulfomicrobium sp.]
MHESNPLLNWELYPDFPSISASHVVPAIQEVIARSSAELEALEQAAPRTWHGLLVPLERLTDRVSRAWGLATHLHNVKNSPNMREAYAQTQPLVVKFHNRLGQSRPVYDALVALRENPEFPDLSQALQRAITLLIRDAALQGVGLSPESRERFNAVSQELAELSTRFTNNVLDATQAYALTLTEKEQIQGLPQDSLRLAASMARARGREQATAENGPWCVTLDLPSFLSFMQHASRRDLREEVYRAYITRAASGDNDNLPLIRRILELRRELAGLLGFENFAAVSLERKMAPDVGGIESLLRAIQNAATDPALNDLIELGELARSHGQSEDIQPWDVMYWAERLKEQRFGLRDELVRPYFPLPAILRGLFQLIGDLFEVDIEIRADVPVWHQDVSYYRVTNREGAEIAGFYLDPYARPEEKRGGAWMDELCGRSTVCAPSDQPVRLPVAYVNCNQRPALDDAPSLMSFQEVTTLFHEFGHALQHMLTTVNHGLVAGIANVEWDAVELASQFMENWCYHPQTLSGLARHYQTGEAMDAALLDKLLEARTFRAGSNALRQVCFALTDLALHTADPDTLDPMETAQRIAREILPLPPLPEDRFLCSFSHIFAGGYAAGYYSYKWAEVLSADAFGAFVDAGLEDPTRRRDMGLRFRNTVLALGGSRHPMDVFRLFRGRDPDPHALLRQEGLLPENKDN